MTQALERTNAGHLPPYGLEAEFGGHDSRLLAPIAVELLPGTGTNGAESLADAVDATRETLGLNPDSTIGVPQGHILEVPPELTGVLSRGFVACSALIIQHGERIAFGHVWPGRTNLQAHRAAWRADGWLDGNERIIAVRGSQSSPVPELDDLVNEAGDRASRIDVDSGRSWWTLGLNLQTGALRIAHTGPERGLLVYDTSIRREAAS